MYVSLSSWLIPLRFKVPFPSGLSQPLYASVTFLEATSPVKLPTRHCFFAGSLSGKKMRVDSPKERCFIDVPTCVGTPSYTRQFEIPSQCQVTVKLPGSFCPGKTRPHLHSHFNFVGSMVKTVACSFYLSCGSELTRQGTSLPWNSYSYCCRSLGLIS